jgi:hypothetical protein
MVGFATENYVRMGAVSRKSKSALGDLCRGMCPPTTVLNTGFRDKGVLKSPQSGKDDFIVQNSKAPKASQPCQRVTAQPDATHVVKQSKGFGSSGLASGASYVLICVSTYQGELYRCYVWYMGHKAVQTRDRFS